MPPIAEFPVIDLNAFDSIRGAVQDLSVFRFEDRDIVSIFLFLTELAAIHNGIITCFLE